MPKVYQTPERNVIRAMFVLVEHTQAPQLTAQLETFVHLVDTVQLEVGCRNPAPLELTVTHLVPRMTRTVAPVTLAITA